MVESILVQLLLVLAIIVTNPLQTKQAEDLGIILRLPDSRYPNITENVHT
ncbi:MAG TPA: hypothetical protein VIW25_01400 [Nitrososphaeraceae archaeon]